MHFRAANSTTLLFSRPASILSPATAGFAILQWIVGDLNQPAGEYTGEVEVVLASGVRETNFSVLQFELRDDFI
jgi:hypothetical protein